MAFKFIRECAGSTATALDRCTTTTADCITITAPDCCSATAPDCCTADTDVASIVASAKVPPGAPAQSSGTAAHLITERHLFH